jgi:chaperonin GroEL
MNKPQQTIFYSWQSDSPPKSNRNFIQDTLDKAVKALASKGNIAVDPVVDRDTRNVAGAPKIADTIFSKIDTAAVFVADVTIVSKITGETADRVKSLPNPNVLVELGYALKVLEDKRLVLIANTAYGRIEDLPFDLLGRKTLGYSLPEKHLGNDAESQKIRKQVKDKLIKDLEGAILTILLLPPRDFNQMPAPLLILKGARSLRNNAASLIGPRGGRATVFKLGERQGTVTRNGLTIAAQLTHQDHYTRQGIDLLSKAAYDARGQAGDGAKTAMLLCYELVNGGYDGVDKGELLSDVLSGMERAAEKTVNYIQKQRRPLNRDSIFNVAETAGGAAVAQLVVEAFEKAKPEGVWVVQEDEAPAKSSVEIQEGIVFHQGYLADEFANDPHTGNCILEDCFVLVYDDKISSNQQILKVLGEIGEAKKPVFILAEDIEGEALKLLVYNNKIKSLSCVAVRAPGYREKKGEWLRDVAIITGADLLGGYYGRSIENADSSNLGWAERIVVGKDETQIIPGKVDEEQIAIRLAQLHRQIDQTPSDERAKLRDRLANLIGNTAVIKVGGRTRDELLDNEYKVTTAMHSVKWALAHGYVLGGGLTYYNAQRSLNRELKLKSLSQGEKVGIKVVQRALEEPLRCLLASGKKSIDDFQEHSEGQAEVGYNLVAKKYENLSKAGVWDSVASTQLALQIALSHARMILETTSWDTIQPDRPFL